MSKEQELKEIFKLYSKQDLWNRIQEKQEMIYDLEAKLAESEEQLKEELVEKKGLESALSACNRQNDEFAEMIKKLVSEKEELKQQLAEKDAEIRVAYSFRKRKCDNLQKALAEKERQVKKLNLEAQKYFEDAYCNDSIYQDKISFAIEQLEKVKELLNTDFESIISWIDPYEYGECLNSMTYNHKNTIEIINNQINELKRFFGDRK